MAANHVDEKTEEPPGDLQARLAHSVYLSPDVCSIDWSNFRHESMKIYFKERLYLEK